MKYISLFKVKKSVTWEEIKNVQLMSGSKPGKSGFKWHPAYLVFTSDGVLDTWSKNKKSNFCIWFTKSKIYNAILPHLSKLSEEHQIKIKEFFENRK